jgi:hypothetical protein
MDPRSRAFYNQVFSAELFAEYEKYLSSRVGAFSFRLAETPLFLSHALRDRLKNDALAICAELSVPATLTKMKQAIPAQYDAPNMTALPECVQVDFALVENEKGELEGKVVELQGFPSLYALEVMMADGWREVLASRPNLDRDWTCLFDVDRQAGMDRIARLLTGGEDPEHVAMIDLDPHAQKTWPDFAATKLFFGIEPTSATHVIKRGNKLFREVAGREVPIRRIYNRLVFDELEVKKITLPFSWKDDLDVTWCAHPNWYWAWSKYSLPFLRHPAVPKTRFLSDVKTLPDDLSRYVMKPLFSYAGAGVVVDVTPEAIARVPEVDRHNFILQEKVDYANAITMPSAPEGRPGVKAEVRIMLMADGDHHVPILPLVRLSRGKMLGVDFNRGLDWTGGTVGIWDRDDHP